MKIRRGPEAYYLVAKEILEQSSFFKVMAKTPTLFLVSQMIHDYQISYLQSLLRALENRQTSFQYLFSFPLTRGEILGMKREEALQSVELWKSYSAHPRIDLRFNLFDNPPFSCCIGNERTVVLWPYDGRAAVVYENQENPLYSEYFDVLFQQAYKQHEKSIGWIVEELKRMKN